MNERTIAVIIMNKLTTQLIINTAFIVLSGCPERDGMNVAYTEAVVTNQSGVQLPVDKMTIEIIGVRNIACTSIVIVSH